MSAYTSIQDWIGRHRAWVVGGLAVPLLAASAVALRAGLHSPASAAAAPAPALPAAEPLDPAAAPEALVFVSGAVSHPGLYRLSPGARIADAVAAAGGITADADPSRLPNLAARVHDGRQVNVPLRHSSRGVAGSATGRVDINSATVEELSAVPGMPAGLPEAIVESRSSWGPFSSVSELRTRLGVDSATLTALRPLLRAATAP